MSKTCNTLETLTKKAVEYGESREFAYLNDYFEKIMQDNYSVNGRYFYIIRGMCGQRRYSPHPDINLSVEVSPDYDKKKCLRLLNDESIYQVLCLTLLDKSYFLKEFLSGKGKKNKKTNVHNISLNFLVETMFKKFPSVFTNIANEFLSHPFASMNEIFIASYNDEKFNIADSSQHPQFKTKDHISDTLLIKKMIIWCLYKNVVSLADFIYQSTKESYSVSKRKTTLHDNNAVLKIQDRALLIKKGRNNIKDTKPEELENVITEPVVTEPCTSGAIVQQPIFTEHIAEQVSENQDITKEVAEQVSENQDIAKEVAEQVLVNQNVAKKVAARQTNVKQQNNAEKKPIPVTVKKDANLIITQTSIKNVIDDIINCYDDFSKIVTTAFVKPLHSFFIGTFFGPIELSSVAYVLFYNIIREFVIESVLLSITSYNQKQKKDNGKDASDINAADLENIFSIFSSVDSNNKELDKLNPELSKKISLFRTLFLSCEKDDEIICMISNICNSKNFISDIKKNIIEEDEFDIYNPSISETEILYNLNCLFYHNNNFLHQAALNIPILLPIYNIFSILYKSSTEEDKKKFSEDINLKEISSSNNNLFHITYMEKTLYNLANPKSAPDFLKLLKESIEETNDAYTNIITNKLFPSIEQIENNPSALNELCARLESEINF